MAAGWVKTDGLDHMSFDDVDVACLAIDVWEDAQPDEDPAQ